MKKRGFRSGFIIIVVLIVSLYLLRDRSPFGKSNSSFTVKEGTEITGIDLLKEDKKVSLRKHDNDWTLIDGREVRKQAVLMLERIVGSLEIKSPVTPESFDNDVVKKGIIPVRVNLRNGRRTVKSFWVYITDSNIYGNVMKVRVNSKPYIVYMPGFEGDIGKYFNPDPRFWQPFLIFSYLPSEIKSLDFRNMSDPSSSFRIENDNELISLSDNSGVLTGWDTTKVKRYLSYFTAVQFERWATELDPGKSDSIAGSRPIYIIGLQENNGSGRILSVWQKNESADDTGKIDTDRAWGKINNSGPMFLIRYFDLDPLIKRKSYFFEK